MELSSKRKVLTMVSFRLNADNAMVFLDALNTRQFSHFLVISVDHSDWQDMDRKKAVLMLKGGHFSLWMEQ